MMNTIVLDHHEVL